MESDMSETLGVVFCGSVDHGKSTLMGHLLKMFNYIDDREFEKICIEAKKNGMERWKYAYILDILDEERLRGKTHDYSIVNINVELYSKKRNINFIDTPGHKQLVSKLVEGGEDADIAILLISLRKGEFEAGLSGQTIEHLYLVRSMGIKQLVVVFNKMDLINWDKEELQKRTDEVKNIIKKMRFPSVTIVPISAYEGLNLVEDYVDDNGYNYGPSLMKIVLDAKKREPEKYINITNNRFISQMIFFDIPTIISAGYKMVLHNGKNQYNAEIIKIKDKKFLRKNESGTVTIKLDLDYNIDRLQKNIILRDGDITVGVGMIVQDIKPDGKPDRNLDAK